MKKSKISIDKINNAIKKIVEQIEVSEFKPEMIVSINTVSYTHLRAHET